MGNGWRKDKRRKIVTIYKNECIKCNNTIENYRIIVYNITDMSNVCEKKNRISLSDERRLVWLNTY